MLRSRAGVSSKPSKRQQEREEEKLLSQRTSDVIENSQGHVNLFEDLEKVCCAQHLSFVSAGLWVHSKR